MIYERPKKCITLNGLELCIFDLGESDNNGCVQNILLRDQAQNLVELKFENGRKFNDNNSPFDYFVNIEIIKGRFFLTTFSCISYTLDESGLIRFSAQGT